nr:hypothetical protein [Candidatus Poriferisodalis multihospitum]
MVAALVEPAAKGCVCEVDAESMTEAVGVDDRARRTVDGNGDRVGEVKIVASDVEGVAVEPMPGHGSPCLRLPMVTRQGDVDGVWDLVGEVVVSEGGGKAEGGVRAAQSQLEKVWVGTVSDAGVDTARNAFQIALCGQLREVAVRDPEVAGLGVCQRDRNGC